MALDTWAALRDGFDRAFERNGVLLLVAFLALELATEVVAQSVIRANARMLPAIREQVSGPTFDLFSTFADRPTPLALPIPIGGAVALALAVALLAEAVRIVGVRTLVSDRTDAIPREFVRRNLGGATLNGFVGGIVVFALTAVGLVLLVVPGLFLAVSLFFVRQVIAVEDESFVEAMAESWALVGGSRIEVFTLGAILLVVNVVVGVLSTNFADPAAASVGGAVGGAVTTVFGMAVASRAYVQLRDERDERLGADELDGVGFDG